MKNKKGVSKSKGGKIAKLIKNSSFKTLFIVVVFLVLAFLNVRQALTIVQLQYENADLKEEMFDYQNENKVITERLEKVGTDQYIEEKAKEELGMVKSGETPIKIIETEDEEIDVNSLDSNDKINIYVKDWYSKLEDWVSYLKKK